MGEVRERHLSRPEDREEAREGARSRLQQNQEAIQDTKAIRSTSKVHCTNLIPQNRAGNEQSVCSAGLAEA